MAQMIGTPFGPFITGAPKGMCPWGEAKCDEECSDFSGCKLSRHDDEHPTHGKTGTCLEHASYDHHDQGGR